MWQRLLSIPVTEASSTGVSENPAVIIAHFRHPEVHRPGLASTLSFNSVQLCFTRQSIFASSSPSLRPHKGNPTTSYHLLASYHPPWCQMHPKLLSTMPLTGLSPSVVLALSWRAALPNLMPPIFLSQPPFPLLIPLVSSLALFFSQNSFLQTCIITYEI